MDDEIRQVLESARRHVADGILTTVPEEEMLDIPFYPEDQGDMLDEHDQETELLVRAAHERMGVPPLPTITTPIGYVSNARNASSQSDLFQFWAPAEETLLGIGSIVRHTSLTPRRIDTYGIIVNTEGSTLGLDDYAVHVYEQDAQPPLTSILPSVSTRRPIVNYQVKVLASTHPAQRPVLSGPVYTVTAAEMANVHNRNEATWLDPEYMLLGFYEDAAGAFGIFGEDRTRVLGPKQGHVILSGLPGAGKTSLFLTLVISLFAQLHDLEGENDGEA